MATLNTRINVDLEESSDASSDASMMTSPLTWNWKTWPRNLRRAMLISVGVLLLLIVFIFFLEEEDKKFNEKLDSHNSLKAQALTKLRESDQERATIMKYLPLLRELESRGIFGEEKRLEWVEQLRIIEKRWPGISIRYDIAAQKVVPKEGSNATPAPPPAGAKLPNGDPVKNFGVFSTDMKLTLHLLHEGDALAIFDELRIANLGLFSVKRCAMKRPDTGIAADIMGDFGAPLTVECTLNWISMNAYAT